jgi:simple sugar transport system permease protein
MKRLFSPRNVPVLATFAVCVLLYTAGAVRFRGFASLAIFAGFFSDNAVLGVAAVGMTFVILSGGIDLSVGSMVGLTTVALAMLLEEGHVPSSAAIPLVLAGGLVFGLAQGTLIQRFGLPPFLVTLAGMFLARGLALLLHDAMPIAHGLDAFSGLSITFAGQNISAPVIIFGAVLLVSSFVAHFTRFGRWVYAVGGNEQSAFLMGLPVARTKIAVYALSGFCSALAGVVCAIFMQSGDPRHGRGLELDAIAAVVIGGALLTGGVGYIFGTLLGVLILGMIQTGISFQGNMTAGWTRLFIGGLLLAFILLQRFLQSRKFGRKKPATAPSN